MICNRGLRLNRTVKNWVTVMELAITAQSLLKIYEVKQTNGGQRITLDDSNAIIEYYFKSESSDFYYENNSGNNRWIYLDTLFTEHCRSPCCLQGKVNICMIHKTNAFFCFIRHLLCNSSYDNCQRCSLLRIEEKNNIKHHFNSTSMHELYSRVINHIRKCRGCWKCNCSSLERILHAEPTLIYPRSESSISGESDFDPIPNGIFYTQESDKHNHSGYLRIIPVSLENDAGMCMDYKKLVDDMNKNLQYKEERDLTYRSIENEDRDYKSLLNPKNPLFEQIKLKYGVNMENKFFEEVSISIKKYLFYIMWYCKKEKELLNEGSDVIDEKVLLRVLRKYPFCVSNSFSFDYFVSLR